MRRERSSSGSGSRAPPAPLVLWSPKQKTAGFLYKLACTRTRAPRLLARQVWLPRQALATWAGRLGGAGPEPLAVEGGGLEGKIVTGKGVAAGVGG